MDVGTCIACIYLKPYQFIGIGGISDILDPGMICRRLGCTELTPCVSFIVDQYTCRRGSVRSVKQLKIIRHPFYIRDIGSFEDGKGVELCGIVYPGHLFLDLLDFLINTFPVLVRVCSVGGLDGKFGHPVKHVVDLVESALAYLKETDTVLDVFGGFVKPTYERAHFFGYGKTCRIIRCTVDAVT